MLFVLALAGQERGRLRSGPIPLTTAEAPSLQAAGRTPASGFQIEPVTEADLSTLNSKE